MNKFSGHSVGSTIAAFIIVILLLPFLSFWVAYFLGWLASFLIGNHLVNGLALIGIKITTNQIPLLAGTLGWIASFFAHINNKD